MVFGINPGGILGGVFGGPPLAIVGQHFGGGPQQAQPQAQPQPYVESPEERQARVNAEIERRIREDAERREQRQVGNQRQIIDACRAGNLDQVPGLLRELDDNHFLALSQQTPEGSEETLNRMCEMLIAEQNRRFPNNAEG